MKACFLTYVNLILAAALLLTPFLVGITSSALYPYDAWSDLDDDGNIDIFDVVEMAGSYDTTGDPTKNVNVTNWPVRNQRTVFYGQVSPATSLTYGAYGFSQIHLTWSVTDLYDPESVTINIWARIDDPQGGAAIEFVVKAIVATHSENYSGAMTIPVPSQYFHFNVEFAPETTTTVYLAFYLTYA